jgi:hypothetical protein
MRESSVIVGRHGVRGTQGRSRAWRASQAPCPSDAVPRLHGRQVAEGVPGDRQSHIDRSRSSATRVAQSLSGQFRRPSGRGNALIAEVQDAPMFAAKAHD